MDIFPFIDPEESIDEYSLEQEVPLAREWAWDFDKNKFKLKNGKMYIVEKNEAIKIWIYKILKTDRFKYLIYNHDYGNDINQFIGLTGSQSYIKAEIKRVVEEAIYSSLSDYITDIRNFEVDIIDDQVYISMLVPTIYDEEVEIFELQISR